MCEVLFEEVRVDCFGYFVFGCFFVVVYVEWVEYVQEMLCIVIVIRIFVVVCGVGIGFVGVVNVGIGEIVFFMWCMIVICEVWLDDLLVVVEFGILNVEFNVVFVVYGLWWLFDFVSCDIFIVGGNIVIGVGGLFCVKYGVVCEVVFGVDFVFVDGCFLYFGYCSVKGVIGFDLILLVIGFEGILGVVVGVIFKFWRFVLGEICMVMVIFFGVCSVVVVFVVVIVVGVQLVIMELMDVVSLIVVYVFFVLLVLILGVVQFIIQIDGFVVGVEVEMIVGILCVYDGVMIVFCDCDEGECFFVVWCLMYVVMVVLGMMLIEDVFVFCSVMFVMFDEIVCIECEYGFMIFMVVYVGDGNLYLNFIFDGLEMLLNVWVVVDEFFCVVIVFGGIFIGEYGIGVFKCCWFVVELGDDQWEFQCWIVVVFDLFGIFNFGKVFDFDV